MRQVFVTGATGVIGSALVPLYLEEPDTRVKLLLRPKRSRDIVQRLRELGDFWGLPENDPRWRRIEAVEGDAAFPRFGLADSAFDALGRSVTDIVHCAGAVKMTLPLEEARAHAVVPAQAALDLAELSRAAGLLNKVEIVSTVGVGGRTPGVIPEKPLPDVAAFHNTYEHAKADAERCVLSRWHDLPIAIHRPSMVVGDSRTGRIVHFQVFYHLCQFLSGARTAGLMPSLARATLDIVPVDYVARAIHWSSSSQSTAGKILHLCSGARGAVPLPALVERIRNRSKAAGISLPRVRYLPLSIFRGATPLLALFAGKEVKRALGNLDLFLAYLDELQVFANESTTAHLSAAGIDLPTVETYLDTVLDYHQHHRAS